MRREEVDHTTVARLIRDICYLYHEFADYRSIMPDLDFGGIYSLPYWEFLETSDYVVFESIPSEDAALIREGCLVMTFTMAADYLEGQGGQIGDNLLICRTLVERMIPVDERDDKLIDAVKRILQMAETERRVDAELHELSFWVYNECVRRYFSERAGLNV